MMKKILDALFDSPGEKLRRVTMGMFVLGITVSAFGSIALGIELGLEAESFLVAIPVIAFSFLLLAVLNYLLALPMICFAELVSNSSGNRPAQMTLTRNPAAPLQPVPATPEARPAAPEKSVPEARPAAPEARPVAKRMVAPAPAKKPCVTTQDVLEYSLGFESVRGMKDYLRFKAATFGPEEQARLNTVLNAEDPHALVKAWVKEMSAPKRADCAHIDSP